MKRNLPARLAVCAALAVGMVAFGPSPAEANPPDTTITINLGQPGKAATHAGAGFLYGLTQDGSGPADNLLQPLRPTLFRGGGASISGNGWIGDNYTAGPGYQARITSALNQARRVTASPYNARYDLLVSDLYGPGFDAPPGTHLSVRQRQLHQLDRVHRPGSRRRAGIRRDRRLRHLE